MLIILEIAEVMNQKLVFYTKTNKNSNENVDWLIIGGGGGCPIKENTFEKYKQENKISIEFILNIDVE